VIVPIPAPLPCANTASLIPCLEYISVRHADSSGLFTRDSRQLGTLRLRTEITDYVPLTIAVENILDTFCEIRYNTLMSGRSFTITATVKY
jgi:hypothetical protein